MLYWAVILIAVIINTTFSGWLPKFEGLILILHVLGFFGILFPLVILGPHAPPSEVFQKIHQWRWMAYEWTVFLRGAAG